MAVKGAPTWGYAKTPCSHPGISDLGSTRSGLAFNLSFRKWECCCLGVASAQRAITPVEDEKPNLTGAESSRAIQRIEDNESRGFHKDMNLLPSELTQKLFFFFFAQFLYVKLSVRDLYVYIERSTAIQ